MAQQEQRHALHTRFEKVHCPFVSVCQLAYVAQQPCCWLQCCRFKYDSSLVKRMLEKKRAAGKLGGNAAQIRARLKHELNVARQDGKSEEEVQR